MVLVRVALRHAGRETLPGVPPVLARVGPAGGAQRHAHRETPGTARCDVGVPAGGVVVRALLIPVGVSQVRAEFTRRRLAPQLAELQRRHGKDRETLARKTMELYQAEKTSPFAGMLPLRAFEWRFCSSRAGVDLRGRALGFAASSSWFVDVLFATALFGRP